MRRLHCSMFLPSLCVVACSDDGATQPDFSVAVDSAVDATDPCAACKGWQKCQSGSCIFDLASRWDLIAFGAEAAEKKADGSSWDAAGGLPDLYACATVNGTRKCTATKNDTLVPDWNEVLFRGVGGGTLMGGFDFEVQDEDLSDSDVVCSGPVTIDEEGFAKGGMVVTCGDPAFLVAGIKVQFVR